MTLTPDSGPAGLAKNRQKLSPMAGGFACAKRSFPRANRAALRQAEAGTPVADIIRKLGVHENTFYTGNAASAA